MTLARLRVLLAGAELDLKEMGANPETAEIVLSITNDDEPGDQPLRGVDAQIELPPTGGRKPRKRGKVTIILSDDANVGGPS